jgi:Zn-dependent peptidase ImmA (M78 family)/DNA-binding XRE family transcriptional regulator
MGHVDKNAFSAVISERLKEAWLARGMTLDDLGEKTGLSRQSISQFEHGICTPTPQTLMKIIESLDFDINFFTMRSLYIQSNVINFRKLRKAKERAQGKIKVRITWMGHIVAYMQEYLGFPPMDSVIEDKEEYSQEDIEEIALKLREKWALGAGPIDSVSSLLENKGFFISKIRMNENDLDACSTIGCFEDGAHPLICLSFDKTAVRSRFDEAHELGHVVLHSGLNEEYLKNKSNYDRVESEANRFASAFLMPITSFANEAYAKSSVDCYLLLKKRWKVSIGAMIHRLYDTGFISENQYTYLQRQISANGWRKSEPLDDVIQHEQPAMLRNCIKALLDNGIKSAGELQNELAFPLSELETLCGIDEQNSPFTKKKPTVHLRIIP